MNEQCAQIKHAIELAFDIPFIVNGGYNGGDPWFVIIPENEFQELFKLNVTFRNATRVIIDFIPERYSASLITDMSKASDMQKRLFTSFADILVKKKFANIDLLINKVKQNPCAPDTWPIEWRDISCRITRSPVTSEDEKFDPVSLTIDWSSNVIGMFLSLMHVVPTVAEGVNNLTGYIEGKSYVVEITRFERNPINRRLCIAAKGSSCSICGFNFKEVYGDIGIEFIEVHHIEPLSLMTTERAINPLTDLIPVCSNCHSMLHRRKPPYLPEDLRIILLKNRNVK